MIKIVALFAVVIVAGGGLLWNADRNDVTRSEIQDCVVKTAQYNKYPGNPYGPEAYNLFVSECN